MKGTTVTLYEPTQTGRDGFGAPVYEDVPVQVENVLIGQPTTEDVTNALNMFGKRIAYVLGIPKGDAHDWQDRRVSWTDAYGRTQELRSFGFPVTGIEENIPGPWHMKVWVEAYG